MGTAGRAYVTYPMEHGTSLSAPPVDLDPSRTAFFLDFDGTLADIVDDPAQVAVDAGTIARIECIFQRTEGALAIVSGRGMDELDRFLSPLRLPLGAIHGLERRDAEGRIEKAGVEESTMDALASRARAFAADTPGLILEFKRAAVAIHYRQAQYLRERVIRFADAVETEMPSVRLVPGKMVVELKLGTRTKADAIASFMGERPFAGRVPVFAGDDVTDEDAFGVLPRWNGLSVKVGPGATKAGYRLSGPDAVREWLEAVAVRMEQTSAAEMRP